MSRDENWLAVSAKIPPCEMERLKKKYPDRGKISRVVRSLIQMHLDGKIPKLEFSFKETT